ncbi:MAG TPA: hypothetical protein VFY73_25890 [Ideonella sp.]|uniref:hypothetical protein n=1 Tax=Ideonella sp. TaxID=1929293 RepID=UPI002E342D0C|nr:hypothetical protein [Ideonella sp.]HEX5687463.1 hypothetical protein [Ideonella sp.]
MRSRFRFLMLGTLSLAATLAAGTARAQFADDWQHVATACTPSNLAALNLVQFVVPNGYIRANNPNAGIVRYTCNVLDSFVSVVPTWNALTLQYLDAAGGRVTATLYAKSKATGIAGMVATVTGPASAVVANASVAVPGLNFAANAYYVVISISTAGPNPPQAHMVSLHQ